MKKVLAIILMTLIGCLQSAVAGSNQKSAEDEIKAQISNALSKDREVTVKLKNGNVIKGKIQIAEKDSFKIEKAKSTSVETINYSDVASVKVHGSGSFGKVFGTIVGGPAYATGGWKGVVFVAALMGGLIAIVASSRD